MGLRICAECGSEWNDDDHGAFELCPNCDPWDDGDDWDDGWGDSEDEEDDTPYLDE